MSGKVKLQIFGCIIFRCKSMRHFGSKMKISFKDVLMSVLKILLYSIIIDIL